MQSATAVQVMPVQNAARQARCTSTNGTADGYMMSSCSSPRQGAAVLAEGAVESGVLKCAGAPVRGGTTLGSYEVARTTLRPRRGIVGRSPPWATLQRESRRRARIVRVPAADEQARSIRNPSRAF